MLHIGCKQIQIVTSWYLESNTSQPLCKSPVCLSGPLLHLDFFLCVQCHLIFLMCDIWTHLFERDFNGKEWCITATIFNLWRMHCKRFESFKSCYLNSDSGDCPPPQIILLLYQMLLLVFFCLHAKMSHHQFPVYTTIPSNCKLPCSSSDTHGCVSCHLAARRFTKCVNMQKPSQWGSLWNKHCGHADYIYIPSVQFMYKRTEEWKLLHLCLKVLAATKTPDYWQVPQIK